MPPCRCCLPLERLGSSTRASGTALIAASTSLSLALNREADPPALARPMYVVVRFLVPSPFRSLVVDHLASNGLPQTLAVFLPESGLGASAAAAAAALSREDTLQALPIPADSALFRRVISRAREEAGEDGVVSHHHHHQQQQQQQQQQQRRVYGLLEALVGEVATRSRAVVVDSDTQTEEAGRSHKENLGEREGRAGGGAQGGKGVRSGRPARSRRTRNKRSTSNLLGCSRNPCRFSVGRILFAFLG